MNLIENISRFMGIKPKAFLIAEEINEDVSIIESMNIKVDRFSNLKHLLYKLQSGSIKKYQIGIIHENGSKYSLQILLNFIKTIDPSIKLVVYKDKSELQSKTLLLTQT